MTKPSFPPLKFRFYRVPCNPTRAHPRRTFSWSPIIEIALAKGDRRTRPFYALIDTGADFCMFSMGAARILGIDPVRAGRTSEFLGIGGGHVVAHFEMADIVLGSHRWPCDVAFVEDPKQPSILGREGFLNEFAIALDAPNNEITFHSRG